MKLKDHKSDAFIKVYEKSILDGLFSKKDIINTKDLKTSKAFGKQMMEFLKEVVEELEKKKLFDGELSKKKNETNFDTEEFYQFRSKIIFEARKAVEFRLSKEN